jgi:Ca2+-transporting ATPase
MKPGSTHELSALPGLTTVQAQRRLAEHGLNQLEDREKHNLLATLKDIATEPMFLLLLMAAAIYLALGDLGEGLLLSFFALVTVGLVIFQARRSEHALDALRQLAAPQAQVIRDGKVVRVAASRIVPGDVVVISEGERVPADAVSREAVGLTVDESLLTGESVPVRKVASPASVAAAGPPGGDDLPQLYAGTLVVSGHALAEVTATGRRTEVGRIGASLASIESAPTPLQQQLSKLVRVFGLAAIGACALLVLWYGLQHGAWMQGLLSAIALGMAMLPEEFPMALTVFLALGAWRLARIQVLSRRPAVIEALGAATVLCVDKTGTLTENRMRLRRLATEQLDTEIGDSLPEPMHHLLEYAALASRRGGADPMDRALMEQADRLLQNGRHRDPASCIAREYPLTPHLPAMSLAWEGEGGYRLAAKGAPEAVMDLCHLTAEKAAHWMARVRTLANQGLRVLAVAEGRIEGPPTLDAQHDYDFSLLGLVGFEDPLRPTVPGAVAQATRAGIAVVMITGDHVSTALAMAKQAGIDTAAGALTGGEITRMSDTALAQAVRGVRVFARVLPEQKLRLVEAFRHNGETVAMTGDGVNDAPALKAAHIGIAMGVRGTDVAREAAGLVLLDEDFGRIVGGVRMGRRIFDNLRKVMTYITAIHVPIAGLALLPVLLGLPPLLLPAHVVLTEMVIDPVCSLAFEGAPEDPRVMKRPPRRSQDGLVGWPMLWRGTLQGGLLLAATLMLYVVLLRAGRGEDVARTVAVVSLTVGNLLLVAVNVAAGVGWRALIGSSARAFWWVTSAAGAALALAVALPEGRRLLHFAVPSASDIALSTMAVALSIVLGALLTVRRGDA